jgi:dodecin
MAEDHVERGVLKVIELVGVSDQSFSDAVRQCVTEASRTIRGISGVKVVESSAKVDGAAITEYHVTCRVAFPVERGGSPG